ncbi:MAG TPA: hypothetical protein VF898_08600 [Chloroflexota bacterium]
MGIEWEVVYPWWRQLHCYLPHLLNEIDFQPGLHVVPRREVTVVVDELRVRRS